MGRAERCVGPCEVAAGLVGGCLVSVLAVPRLRPCLARDPGQIQPPLRELLDCCRNTSLLQLGLYRLLEAAAHQTALGGGLFYFVLVCGASGQQLQSLVLSVGALTSALTVLTVPLWTRLFKADLDIHRFCAGFTALGVLSPLILYAGTAALGRSGGFLVYCGFLFLLFSPMTSRNTAARRGSARDAEWPRLDWKHGTYARNAKHRKVDACRAASVWALS